MTMRQLFPLILGFHLALSVTAPAQTKAASSANVSPSTPSGTLGQEVKIKVVQSKSRPYTTQANGGSLTDCPLNESRSQCDQENSVFTWHHAENTALVQSSDGKQYSISCTASSHFSRCVWLRVGETLDATISNRGMNVTYRDQKGKLHTQLYEIVSSEQAPTKDTSSLPGGSMSVAANGKPVANTPQAVLEISSVPSGADIELDGDFVGNTPSSLGVSSGDHEIKITKSGYKAWERKLKATTGTIRIAPELEPATAK